MSISLAQPAAAASARTAPKQSLDVLIVDDDALTRNILEGALGRMGHRVVCAADGHAAITAIASRRFDIVLMDMHMPELDGAAVTRLIRGVLGPGHRVPIVALTADSQPAQRARHLELDLDAYLTKPVDWGRLNHVIHTVTQARTAELASSAL